MPSKQIYVKEADLPLFAEAEKYGNSLANVVAEALRQYVENKKAEQDAEGFAKIEIEVGRFLPGPADTTKKSFWGKEIGTFVESGRDDDPMDNDPSNDWERHWKAYLTKKGKFIIWCRTLQLELDEYGMEIPHEDVDFRISDELPNATGNTVKVSNWNVPRGLILAARNAIAKVGEDIEELDV